ncbi:hypothetical protein T492DRAFT_547075 [Pavlovales sp. CCMP2436]|nr:hypothetical protein T492DRAFT_547075 [Pavlovales sp. CCMP2436]
MYSEREFDGGGRRRGGGGGGGGAVDRARGGDRQQPYGARWLDPRVGAELRMHATPRCPLSPTRSDALLLLALLHARLAEGGGGRRRGGRGGGGGGRGGGERDGGGGGRGGRKDGPPKTAEVLDDEMDSYWGKDAGSKAVTKEEGGVAKEEPKKGKKGGRGKEEPPAKEVLDDDMDSYWGTKGKEEGKEVAGAAAPAVAEEAS